MTILLGLFFIFAKLSLFSFGGGYVMVPIAMGELEANHWATAAGLTDTVAIATMSPGPVGVNLAIGLGFKVAGIAGAVAAFLGMILPTTAVLILVAVCFFKVYQNPVVAAMFYGIRPVVTGIILYAAFSLAVKNGVILAEPNTMIHAGYNLSFNTFHLIEFKSVLIATAVFMLLAKTKVVPAAIIAACGVIGIIMF